MSQRSCTWQRTSPAVALLAAALLAAGPAAAATARPIGKAGARLKGTSIWYAHATAVRPASIAVRVVPTPARAVKVQWAVVCQKPNPSDPADHVGTASSSGERTVRGAAIVPLRLPYARPPTCVATVYATLSGEGALALRLLQT